MTSLLLPLHGLSVGRLHLLPLPLLPAEVADEEDGQEEEHEHQEDDQGDEDGVLEVNPVLGSAAWDSRTWNVGGDGDITLLGYCGTLVLA